MRHEVHVDHALPFIVGQLDGAETTEDPGVAAEQIDGAVAFLGAVDERGEITRCGSSHCTRPLSSTAMPSVRKSAPTTARAPFAWKRAGERGTDATCRSSDHDVLPLDPHVIRTPSSSIEQMTPRPPGGSVAASVAASSGAHKAATLVPSRQPRRPRTGVFERVECLV